MFVKAPQSFDCDDGNPCTDSSCDEELCCVHVSNSGSCNHGNTCTINDHYVNRECKPDASLDCDEDNPCTDDKCYSALDCMRTPNNNLYDEGNVWTTNNICVSGICKGTEWLDCDDGKICTNDKCNPQLRRIHECNNAPSNDGNVCTTNNSHADGECKGTGWLGCDNGNRCTDDDCNSTTGRYHMPNTDPCDDGNACNCK